MRKNRNSASSRDVKRPRTAAVSDIPGNGSQERAEHEIFCWESRADSSEPAGAFSKFLTASRIFDGPFRSSEWLDHRDHRSGASIILA